MRSDPSACGARGNLCGLQRVLELRGEAQVLRYCARRTSAVELREPAVVAEALRVPVVLDVLYTELGCAGHEGAPEPGAADVG